MVVKCIMLIVILIVILFILVAFIFHLIKELGEVNSMQDEINRKLGNYIVENRKEIYAIKNSIYQ